MPSPLRPTKFLAFQAQPAQGGRNQTQEDLAYSAGITVAGLARIERGQANPRWTTVRSIASALEIGMGELGDTVESAG